MPDGDFSSDLLRQAQTGNLQGISPEQAQRLLDARAAAGDDLDVPADVWKKLQALAATPPPAPQAAPPAPAQPPTTGLYGEPIPPGAFEGSGGLDALGGALADDLAWHPDTWKFPPPPRREPDKKVGMLRSAGLGGALCFAGGGLLGGGIGFQAADRGGGTVLAMPAHDRLTWEPGPVLGVATPPHIDPIQNLTGTATFAGVERCGVSGFTNPFVLDITPPTIAMDVQGGPRFSGTIDGVNYTMAFDQNLFVISGALVTGPMQTFSFTFNSPQCQNGRSTGTLRLTQPLVVMSTKAGPRTAALYIGTVPLTSGSLGTITGNSFCYRALAIGLGTSAVGVGALGWGWSTKRRRGLGRFADDDDGDDHLPPLPRGLGK